MFSTRPDTHRPHALRLAGSRASALYSFALAYGGGLALHLMHEASGAREPHAPPGVWHWLRDASLALPVIAVAVYLGASLASRLIERFGQNLSRASATGLRAVSVAVYASVAMAMGSPLHGLLFQAGHGEHELSLADHLVRDGLWALVANLAIAFGVAAAPTGWRWTARQWARGGSLAWRGATAALMVLAGSGGMPSAVVPVAAAAGSGVCASATRVIRYDVVAFQTVIKLNGWGDRVTDGLMYALSNPDAWPNKDSILANPNLATPLVLRAAVGDCIQITLRNEIAGVRVGMHVDGVSRDPKDSDGASIGNNPDTTVPSGATTTYTWFAHREGQFPINDYGGGTDYQLPMPGGPLQDTTSLGLYAALVVLPQGATWHDMQTGKNLLNAANQGIGAPVQADVHVPGPGNDFRDYVAVFMDEPEDVLDRDGLQPIFPTTGLPDSTFGINYRSEPLRNRLRAAMEHRGEVFDAAAQHVVPTAPKTITLPNGTVVQPGDHFCDGYVPELGRVVDDPGARCLSEESHLTSWVFGDPGKLTHKDSTGAIVVDSDPLVLKAYRNDPVRFRVVHPGIKETHPWHQHTNRWRLENNDPNSTRLDVQSVGPGEAYLLEFEGGAGNIQGSVGDQIFHCHLYPHFAQGFWGMVRVLDRTRPVDSTFTNPDGTPIQPLQELPDRAGRTPAPDAQHPGYPLFVKGDYLQKPYRPPFAVVNDPFQALRRPGDTVRQPTELERANMANNLVDAQGQPVPNALKPDGTANPGAFFLDPCPAGVAERTYYPAAIDAKVVYNSAGWHDPDGKLYVEAPPATPDTGASRAALATADQLRQQINAGQLQTEPYTLRSRLGECVNVRTTNATFLDNDPNVPLDIHAPKGDGFHEPTSMAEVSTHVHLVRFDELGTDGTSVGFNYVQAALQGQTYGYRWYVDTPLRTVFFHDHQHPNTHQQHGLWAAMNVEPADATWHNPRTGQPTNGVGTVADIHSPSGPDFRELTVHYSDFVPQHDAAGQPINAPEHPDHFGADQGVMAINYRNEPFPIRINSASTGAKAEPAYVFSSAVHGDPSTPIFRAYSGDPVVVRFMNGAHEEVHNFNLAGHRWLQEPDDPNSTLMDSQATAISEFFNFEVQGAQVFKVGDATRAREKAREAAIMPSGATLVLPGGAGAPGDYLYSSQPLNDLWMGMWGLFRVPGAQVADLQPLPDRAAPGVGEPWPALKPGEAIAPPSTLPDIGTPCVTRNGPKLPNKIFSVSLIQQKLVYNAAGDNDPNGIRYVLNQDLANPLAMQEPGVLKPEVTPRPLFMRANEGDCVAVVFTNRLPGSVPVQATDPINPVENTGLTNLVGGALQRVQATWPAGGRASIHMGGLARYDVRWNDGAAVGYNFDSTVAPGKSYVYLYYVDTKDMGVVGFQNLANVRGTRHHGAWGALIGEPKDATYLDPTTGAAIKSGEAAVIKYPDPATGAMQAFREFVVDFQDGLNLFDRNGAPLPDQSNEDPEEQGEKGVNYRSERFQNRLARNPDISQVFSSATHGDPATPVFRAYVGDPVMLRVLNSQDLPRSHTFGLFGHEWPHELNDPNTNILTAQGGLNTGRGFNLDLIGGAGGVQHASGDYLYGDRNLDQQLSGGLWGLLRVHDAAMPDLRPLSSLIAAPVEPTPAATSTPVATSTTTAAPTSTPVATSTTSATPTAVPSPSATTTASGDTTPPLISTVKAVSLVNRSAVVGWVTNEAATTQVEYGPTMAYGSTSTLDTRLTTAHSVTLSGLQPGKLYHYRVRSKDAAGNVATSADATFVAR